MDTLKVMEYSALPLYNFYKIDDVKYIQFGKEHVLSTTFCLKVPLNMKII